MVVNIAHLGGTASSVSVARISVSRIDLKNSPPHLIRARSQHGLMMLGTTPESTDEVYFASLKAGIDELPAGAKMFLNSGM